MSAISAIPKQKPISKEKVKAVLDIMDIAHAFSGQINERPRQPLILCPFHEDKHLGSCRVYRETNTFYCESCHTAGDTLKLASGYLDIPLNQMNDLLETIVSRFGIDRSSVEVDSSARPRRKQLNLLSVEQYRFLNCGKEYVEIPVEFEPFEFENDEIEYWPTRYKKSIFEIWRSKTRTSTTLPFALPHGATGWKAKCISPAAMLKTAWTTASLIGLL